MSTAVLPYNDHITDLHLTERPDLQVSLVMGDGEMFARRRAVRLLITILPVLMVFLGAYQLYDLYASRNAHQHASRMLFEASYFQIELLSRFMSEASSAKFSSQLDALKHAVYSASFVHERLTRAYPAGQVDQLESLEAMMQFVLHLQIGGDRPLKDTETQLLQELDPLLAELSEAYAGMISQDGKVTRFQSNLVRDLDDKLLNLLRRSQ